MPATDQRVSWTLPHEVVERVKTYQQTHGLASQSEAATRMLSGEDAAVPSLSTERHPDPSE